MLKVRNSIDSDGTKNFTKVVNIFKNSLHCRKQAEQIFKGEGVWFILNLKLI